MNTPLRRSLLALVLIAGNAAALADDGKSQPPAPAKPETLKGPAVPDRQVPGVEHGLGTMQRGNDKKGPARELPIPHREFMRMLEDALGPAAPDTVRATPEQRTQVEKISEEFTQKQRAFMQSNRQEIENLVQKYGPEVRQLAGRAAGERGFQGGGADSRKAPKDLKKPGHNHDNDDKPADPMQDKPELSDDARAEVSAKLRELYAGAPKPEDARTAVWGVLKPEQQAAVQKRVDAFKAGREKQMDERYKEREKRKLEERGTKKNPVTPGAPGAGAEPGKPLDAAKRDELFKQLPPDLRDRLSRLRPEMQDRVLSRLAVVPENEREPAYAKVRERLENEGGGKIGKRTKNKK
ncbi:MAG: hypothetical protein K2Q09_11875 [Phycisphaerales bacterium]|nr:hypothetical protein [Phycisphaerales bacterium]